jgi:hypothetical protein
MVILRALRAAVVSSLALVVLVAVAVLTTSTRPLAAQSSLPGAARLDPWPVKTREHVDLWLHGFAMISDDSSLVPLFTRGYRAEMTKLRNAANVTTDLDANRDVLAQRLRENAGLVNAQFLPLYFSGWPEFEFAFEAFIKADGNTRDVSPREIQAQVAFIAAAFPAKADRDFARRLFNSLKSERDLFYHKWWVAETTRRSATLAAVDTLWQRTVRPSLQSYLSRTQQGNGDLLLTLSLGGEGRTISDGKTKNVFAVNFPPTADRAAEAIYGVMHEAVGPLVAPAVEDNVTPAEKRAGVAEQLSSRALVRGGALLLGKVAPQFVNGYMKFYLHAAGTEHVGDAELIATFEKTFVVPKGLIASIERQIAVSFSGI